MTDIYDRLFADEDAKRRATVRDAITVKPDEYAAQKRDAAVLGVPPAAIEADPSAKQDAYAKVIDADLAKAPTLGKKMAGADFAKLAHDDVGVLKTVEGWVANMSREVVGATERGESVLRSVPAGVARLSAGLYGAAGTAAEAAAPLLDPLARLTNAENPLRQASETLGKGYNIASATADAIAKPIEKGGKDDTLISRSMKSAAESIGQTAVALPLGVVGAGTRAASAGLVLQSVGAGGGSAMEARSQGLDARRALLLGAADAAAEFAGERVGFGRLVEDTLKGTGIFKTAVRQIIPEVLGENATTAVQDLNAWALLPQNANKTFGDYLAERPAAAAETTLATLFGVGGNAAISRTMGMAADRLLTQQRNATFAVEDADKLRKLLASAAESKLRERDPDSFAQLVQQAAEDRPGVPARVYVDATILLGEDGQKGLVSRDELAQLVPSITAKQIDEAVATGGALELPLGDIAARVAGTPLEQSLLDHVRTSPEAMSRFEAKAVDEQIADLGKLAKATVEQASDALKAEQEREAVRANLAAQLESAGRFTKDVNEVYARITADFFTTMAGRVGMTPAQLYARYPLRIEGANVGGLEQPAFHGTHAKGIDRFTTAKMGTGEGAQVYGWGMYFAGSRKVGEFYRKTVTEAKAAQDHDYFNASMNLALEMERRGFVGEDTENLSAEYSDRELLALAQEKMPDAPETRAMAAQIAKVGEGQLYSVEVPEDDVLLDYDARFADQPEAVRDALESLDFPADQFHVVLDDGKTVGKFATQAEARAALAGAGKAGSIKRRPNTITGGEVYRMLSATRGGDRAASEALAKAGVPGLRYKDAQSRGTKAESDTRNYVIFKDEAVQKTGEFYQSAPGRREKNIHQDRAAELLAASPTPQRSTVRMFENPTTAPKLEKVEHIARYFTKKNKDALGEWGTPAARRKLVTVLRNEALYALSKDGSAVGWYDRKVKAAMNALEQLHPELATNDEARFAFIVMLAITSNSTGVNENFDHAEELYSSWKKDHVWPSDKVRPNKAAKAMREHLALVGRLVARDGWEATRDYLTSMQPVRGIIGHTGVDVPSELKDSEVRGAVALGSKIGTFFNNLYGNYDSVTMDRWFMRTINRHRGNMLKLPEAFPAQLARLRAATDNADVRAEIDEYLAAPGEGIEAALEKLEKTREYVAEVFKVYAKGFKDRNALNVNAKIVHEAMTLDEQTPNGGADRAELRKVMNDLQRSLAKDGINIEIADLQAVLWYYEKDLFNLLKRQKGPTDAEDYETAARRLLQLRGVTAGDRAGPAGQQQFLQSVSTGTGQGGRGEGPAGRVEPAALLNIGLAIPDSDQFKTRDDVMAALDAVGAKVTGDTQHASDTEPTIVVELAEPLTPEQADAVSVALQQEAIVQRMADGSGALHGPSATKWGDYNPEFFMMPDGSRAAQPALEQPARGTFNPSTLQISLLEHADLSTFLHELGHFGLEVMADLASQPQAPAGVVEDMAALLKWFGIKAGDNKTALDTWRAMSLDQQRVHHEKFAEAFEQYLFEGKAPTHDLQALFAKVRAWMTGVYRSLKQFLGDKDKTLTPSVRGVFDRMLASEDAIAEAQQIEAYAPLFKDAAAAGMEPEEFEKYLALGQQATDNAVSALTARSLRDMRWVANARAKALAAEQKRVEGLRRAAETTIRAELQDTPVERARAAIRALQKDELKTSAAAKEQRAAWTTQYKAAEGESREAHKDMPAAERKLAVQQDMLQWELNNPAPQPVVAEGKLQLVAEANGFRGVDEMEQTLAKSPSIEQELEGLVDRRLLEEHGDTVTPSGMQRAADESVHNEARARFIATGLKALVDGGKQGEKQQGSKVSVNVLLRAAKQYAAKMVGDSVIRNLTVQKFKAAEARAGKAALEATAAGDTRRAIAETRSQMLNNQLVRTATAALADIEKSVRYLRGVADSQSIDPEYREQIDSLLERFDLKEVSGKQAAKRKALAAWVDEQRAIGIDPELPDSLLAESHRVPYRDMSVDEFRGLVAAVRQIEHIGRLKTKLLLAKDQREFAETRDAIAASVIDNAGDRKADTRSPTTNLGRVVQAVRRFGAAHIKAATWARVFDGGKDGGPVWDNIIRPANERADYEATRRAKATQDLSAILGPWMKKGNLGTRGTYFAAVDRELNREAVLAIALNTGNDGNLQRLLDGEGWTMDQLQPVLASLTRDDWRTVQAVWDYFDSFRPEIGAKQKRVYGTEPEWVPAVARSYDLADGTAVDVRGGYYPVKYDPAASVRAEEHADAEGAKRQLQGAYGAATTRRSFTKTRAESVTGRPLLYTLSGVYSGISDVIHDLAWHEWLIDTNRLLKSEAIDTAIRSKYGPEAVRQLKSWRDAIAEGDGHAQEALDSALGYLRQSVSVAGLGFNVMSAAMQPLGLTQSIQRVGAKWIGKGLMHYVANPVRAARTARAASEFMRNRDRTRMRELNELRNRVQGASTTKLALQEGAYFLMQKVQAMVDVPTWLGAYEKAMAAGSNEDRAVALADQAVKDSQGGGQITDLSAIERGGPAQKLFTVFYTFMNTALNLGVAAKMSPGSRVKFAADLLLIYTVPAVLGSLLKDALTPGDAGDDDEALAKKLLQEQVSYLMGLMVVVRELANVGKFMAGADTYRDYEGPAGLRVLAETGKAAQQIAQGEADDGLRKSLVNMAGYIAGLPSAQINRTITGAQALAEGQTANPAALLFGYQEPK